MFPRQTLDLQSWEGTKNLNVGLVTSMVFLEDGHRIVLAGQGGVVLWDSDGFGFETFPAVPQRVLQPTFQKGGSFCRLEEKGGARLWSVGIRPGSTASGLDMVYSGNANVELQASSWYPSVQSHRSVSVPNVPFRMVRRGSEFAWRPLGGYPDLRVVGADALEAAYGPAHEAPKVRLGFGSKGALNPSQCACSWGNVNALRRDVFAAFDPTTARGNSRIVCATEGAAVSLSLETPGQCLAASDRGGEMGYPNALAFSGDGNTLATMTRDGVHVFPRNAVAGSAALAMLGLARLSEERPEYAQHFKALRLRHDEWADRWLLDVFMRHRTEGGAWASGDFCFEIFGGGRWRLFRYEHGLCNIEQTEADEDDEDDEYDVCRAFPVAGSAGPVLQAIEAVLAGEVVVPITARDDGAMDVDA